MTGCAREAHIGGDGYEAAVLCTVSGCKIVYVGVKRREDGERVAFSFVSSLNRGGWSKPSDASDLELEEWEWYKPCDALHLAADAFIYSMPAVLVDDALHFMIGYEDGNDSVGILRYSLCSDSLSVIDAPLAESVVFRDPLLMAMKDGSLGFAHLDRFILYVWSRKIDSHGGASWARDTVVYLKNLLPIENPKSEPRLIGSMEGGDIIFVNMDLGVYEIDLQTLAWKERLKGEGFHALIPYMSFYNPSD
ncbi:hypothetical protein ACQJBY_072148 [Aegilops geniculata]